MAGKVSISRHGDVGVIHLTAPPGQGLDARMRDALAIHLRQAEADSRLRVLVLFAEGDALAAEPGRIAAASPSADVRALAAQVEDCRKPVIGALDGTALDEGLEVFLACRLRYASRRSRFGFPLGALGAMPAGGGTQRLPRLVGCAAALDLLTAVRLIEAPLAATLGLVDGVEKEPLVGAAVSIHRPAPRGGRHAGAGEAPSGRLVSRWPARRRGAAGGAGHP